MSVPAERIISIASNDPRRGAKEVIKDLKADELIFAVVGPVGSGTTWVTTALESIVRNAAIPDVEVTVIKASTVIESWAKSRGISIDDSSKLTRAKSLQDAGDVCRREDASGVAVQLINAIRDARSVSETKLGPGKFRVYVLDSLKHPSEVSLLRSVYQDAFCLIGVVCESTVRTTRLKGLKCKDSLGADVDKFIARDEDSEFAYGQKVADTFHLADFFVDNTPNRFLTGMKENPKWDVADQLGRLLDILTHAQLVRPRTNETGMFHAYGAQLRSACLSRQVGAALTDRSGNVISTGTNEVPRGGGGVYGGQLASYEQEELLHDHRCVYSHGNCSNTKAQEAIIDELIQSVPELTSISDQIGLKKMLKKTQLGRLIEFSRAVHAEMDALLSAARVGYSPVGTKLYVTTFPCHYCARHIVAAGVDEVQYIEPYPKSRALTLHGDAIAQSTDNWKPPSIQNRESTGNGERKVLFRPFTGVAPRFYKRAFTKDRKLKDDVGDMSFGEPSWTAGLLKMSYQDIETRLVEKEGKQHE